MGKIKGMENTTPNPERQEKARQYARISRRLMLVNLVISGGYALAWLAFGWSQQWSATVQALTPNPWFQVPIYLLGFGGL
ncbi:MAG: hypothetical protein QXU75_08810, partial [Candidatus Methanomethylicaceae archaeon]